MGIPLQRSCAAKGCTRLGPSPEHVGLHFTAAEAFTRPVPDAPQLWACCMAHKKETLLDILKGLPYRMSSRCHRATTTR